MIMNKEKENIEIRNAKINNSIYISRSREKDEGFKLLEKHIRLLEQDWRFGNIFNYQNERDLLKAQAKVELCQELLGFLDHAEKMAYKKKKDPETGEEEKL